MGAGNWTQANALSKSVIYLAHSQLIFEEDTKAIGWINVLINHISIFISIHPSYMYPSTNLSIYTFTYSSTSIHHHPSIHPSIIHSSIIHPSYTSLSSTHHPFFYSSTHPSPSIHRHLAIIIHSSSVHLSIHPPIHHCKSILHSSIIPIHYHSPILHAFICSSTHPSSSIHQHHPSIIHLSEHFSLHN